eukprot:15611797-Heterocapsa_arctica.AAC.1
MPLAWSAAAAGKAGPGPWPPAGVLALEVLLALRETAGALVRSSAFLASSLGGIPWPCADLGGP